MAHLKGASESSRKLNLAGDPKAVASFEALKHLLMSPQLLVYPDFDGPEPFIVNTDHSHDGIGTVLSQIQNGVERPIALNARRLKTSESQYASHKGELLSLIFAIDTYKFFLTGRKFLVRTDNSALSWLKTRVLMIGDHSIGNRDFWRFLAIFGDRDLIGITIVDDRDLSDFFFPKCPSRSRSH